MWLQDATWCLLMLNPAELPQPQSKGYPATGKHQTMRFDQEKNYKSFKKLELINNSQNAQTLLARSCKTVEIKNNSLGREVWKVTQQKSKVHHFEQNYLDCQDERSCWLSLDKSSQAKWMGEKIHVGLMSAESLNASHNPTPFPPNGKHLNSCIFCGSSESCIAHSTTAKAVC